MTNSQGIQWPESNEALPLASYCDCYQEGKLTVSIRDGDRVIVHHHVKMFLKAEDNFITHKDVERATGCAITFDELSLNNFELKR